MGIHFILTFFSKWSKVTVWNKSRYGVLEYKYLDWPLEFKKLKRISFKVNLSLLMFLHFSQIWGRNERNT